MAKFAVVFEANREGYTIGQVADRVPTIGEMKEILDQYDDDDLFVLSHDNGYTYGSVDRYPDHRRVEED